MGHSENNKKSSNIKALIRLIETLRGENGCPWDREQTPQSMVVYLVEEIYELVDAIESGNVGAICEELGDVLFQALFIARLYEEMGHFDVEMVAEKNRKKMIQRHPHVFGNEKVDSPDQVRQRWREIKNKENRDHPGKSFLDSVPRKLPALMRAYRISDRAAGQGFDWDDISGVILKVEEEWSEFKFELGESQDPEKKKERLALEFGDVLFTLVNVARFSKIHPETALSSATRKFEKRFRYMEKILFENGESLNSVSRDALERLWELSKKEIG